MESYALVSNQLTPVFTSIAPIFKSIDDVDTVKYPITPTKVSNLRQNGYVIMTDREGDDHVCKIIAMCPTRT